MPGNNNQTQDYSSAATKTELRDLTAAILDPARAPFSLRPEILALIALIQGSSGYVADPANDLALGETRSAEGLAVSPAMAAKCAEDFARTVVFMRGAMDAIAETRRRAPGRAVHVLYAGCGPLAILCLPLMSLLAEGDAVFTLIDMHETSVAAVKRAVDALGFADKVDAILCADALHFTPDPARPVDVIVVETMTACLKKEPQVALTRHLLAHSPGAILVPASVRISAALMSAPNATGAVGPEPIDLGTVFDLSTAQVASWRGITGDLPAGSATFPTEIPVGLHPMLRTTIHTHGAHVLTDYNSGLTIPRAFPSAERLLAGATFHFRYRCGERPGLIVHALSPDS